MLCGILSPENVEKTIISLRPPRHKHSNRELLIWTRNTKYICNSTKNGHQYAVCHTQYLKYEISQILFIIMLGELPIASICDTDNDNSYFYAWTRSFGSFVKPYNRQSVQSLTHMRYYSIFKHPKKKNRRADQRRQRVIGDWCFKSLVCTDPCTTVKIKRSQLLMNADSASRPLMDDIFPIMWQSIYHRYSKCAPHSRSCIVHPVTTQSQ